VVTPSIRRMTKKRLGEILLAEGVITAEQLEEALAEQRKSGRLLGEILIQKDLISEKDIAETLCTQFSFPFISTAQYFISQEVARIVPVEMMSKYLFVPLDKFSNFLTIAVAGSLTEKILNEIEKASGCELQIFVSTLSEVKATIERIAEQREAVEAAQDSASLEPLEGESGTVEENNLPSDNNSET